MDRLGRILSLFRALWPGGSTDHADEATDQSGQPVRLLLHINALGWRVQVVREDGRGEDLPMAWEHSNPDLDEKVRVEQTVRDVVVSLGHSVLHEATSLSILWDNSEVYYSDSKPNLLTAASMATARLFGEMVLNVEECTFGYINLRTGSDLMEKKSGIYAFADARSIRSFLSLFDKFGLKVTEVTPTTALLLQRAVQSGREVYGGLYLGAFESQVVLVNLALTNVLVQTIPLGLATLGREVAKKCGISMAEARHTLAQRDLLADMSAELTEGGLGFQGLSFEQQALHPLLGQLAQAVHAALDFFTQHKVSGRVQALEVMGDWSQIAGLADSLARWFKVGVTLLPELPLAIYGQSSHPMPCNLLLGAERSLISVGRIQYFYTRQGFVRSQSLALQLAARESGKAAQKGQEDGFVPDEELGEEVHSKTLAGRVRQMMQKIHPALGATARNSQRNPGVSDLGSDRTGFGLLGLAMAVAILLVSLQQQETAKRYRENMAIYLEERAAMDRLRQDNLLGQKSTNSGDGESILWTDKLLVLADKLDGQLWLTDIHVMQERRESGGVTLQQKKVVIQGRALASGHMERLSDLHIRLLQDKKFMKGIRSIAFTGAEADVGGATVRFTLEAIHEANPSQKTGLLEKGALLLAMLGR
ncbi:MAG: hypothetical protein G8345_21670 [Magnetococcales bacterium]|nr:hypothetical protein [Magnetococcales bacterium]